MIWYLLLPYYLQCLRAYHHLHKTDDYSRLDAMMSFDECMMVLTESSCIASHFGGYSTMENIWEIF